jgi:hypothetical protein
MVKLNTGLDSSFRLIYILTFIFVAHRVEVQAGSQSCE